MSQQAWSGPGKILDNSLDYIATISSAVADFASNQLFELQPIDEVLHAIKTITSSTDPVQIIKAVSMLFTGTWAPNSVSRLLQDKERQVLNFRLEHDFYNLNAGDLIDFQYTVFYTLHKDLTTETFGASFKQLNVSYSREWDVVVRKDHHNNNHDHLRAYGSWIVEPKDAPTIRVGLDLWCIVFDTSGYAWRTNWWTSYGYTYTATKILGDIDIRAAVSEHHEPDYSLDLRALFSEKISESWELV